MSTDLLPEEKLLAAMVRLAIKDAKGKQERWRDDARRWLWWVVPSVAQRVGVGIEAHEQGN